VYNNIAIKITGGGLSSGYEIIKSLRAVYPTDDQFKQAFTEKQIRTTSPRNRNVARYILFKIEQQVSNAVFDYLSDKYTIEHILPEHPDDLWLGFSEEQLDRSVYRIGNLTLLESTTNNDLKNRPYSEKSPFYRQSAFQITNQLAEEHHEWNPEKIGSRQAWLAKQATAIWRLAELS